MTPKRIRICFESSSEVCLTLIDLDPRTLQGMHGHWMLLILREQSTYGTTESGSAATGPC